MTEPHVWTLIGVFAAGMFGTLTLVSTLFVRVIRSEIAGLRGELLGEISSLRSEMNARFQSLEDRFSYLNRDVNLVMRREFPETP